MARKPGNNLDIPLGANVSDSGKFDLSDNKGREEAVVDSSDAAETFSTDSD